MFYTFRNSFFLRFSCVGLCLHVNLLAFGGFWWSQAVCFCWGWSCVHLVVTSILLFGLTWNWCFSLFFFFFLKQTIMGDLLIYACFVNYRLTYEAHVVFIICRERFMKINLDRQISAVVLLYCSLLFSHSQEFLIFWIFRCIFVG